MRISKGSDRQPLVSVIVPVFNTGQYLDEALHSIREQTLRELQIICVNDASEDDSLEILETNAAADSRIHIISLKSNIGLGAVRNLGIEQAIGRYVYFFDSDDILELEALENLVSTAEQFDLQAIFFNARPMVDRTMDASLLSRYQHQYRRTHSYESGLTGARMLIEMNGHSEWKPSACLYLTRKSLLDDARLSFTEGVLHEDNGFTMRLMLAAERVGYEASEYFVRRIRLNSITTTSPTDLHVTGLLIASLELATATESVRPIEPPSEELAIAVSTQAELIFQDAVQKYLSLTVEHKNKVQNWRSVSPQQAFILARLQDRVDRLEALEACESLRERYEAVQAENTAFRNSRTFKLAKRLGKILGRG